VILAVAEVGDTWMSTDLRIGSLNLRAMPNSDGGQICGLAEIIAAQECDLVLLQECKRRWLGVVCKATGMTGIHSHNLPPESDPRAFSPDGCAIALSESIELRKSWRIPPESFLPDVVQQRIYEEPPADFEPMPQRLAARYSGRSALAEIAVDGRPIVVGSFHGTPASGKVGGKRVGEWKPFFPGAVAIELSELKHPFVFGIDANEPRAETPDTVTFHWADGRSGVEKAKALLGMEPIHRGRDLFREWLATSGNEAASPEVLLATYAPRPHFQRRFDSIWATPDFDLVDFETHLNEVVDAGGDHAMLVAELRLV
jgi:hypothetical protein